MNKQRFIFGIAVGVLVGAFVLGAIVFRQRRAEQVGAMDSSTFVRPHSQVWGSPEAKVTIVEFTDPACETCAAFSPLVKNLMAAHPNQIKLVVRYAPFHQGSDGVVRVLHASTKQGKFWETLEILYGTQAAWASHHQPQPELIWNFLGQGGIDVERLNKDVQSPDVAQAVQQDLADAQALGVTKTPGFFVNGKPLVQFGAEQLQQLVRAEVAAAYAK